MQDKVLHLGCAVSSWKVTNAKSTLIPGQVNKGCSATSSIVILKRIFTCAIDQGRHRRSAFVICVKDFLFNLISSHGQK